ncbi:Uncharacterised protein [uncultured archaeon]|nr:Uncharacterised protein [uncultured archaeon]
MKVATLHYKETSRVKPDFFAETTSDWLVYPWERRETELGLGKRKLKTAGP